MLDDDRFLGTSSSQPSTSNSGELTFKKRVDPHGWDLYKNNKYYKPPLNNQMFNTATGGNCVWYAYGRFLEVWSEAPEEQRKAHPWPGWFSNDGVGMVSSAKNKGFETGLTPKPGAIISWGYYGSANGNPGHVAFVESVNKDEKGNVVSIEVSQSGWSSGDLKNWTLKPGPGTRGTQSWIVNNGYCQPYFVGFAYNPIPFTGAGKGTVTGEDEESSGTGIDWQKRASKLISSDNYTFLKLEEEEQTPKTDTAGLFKNLMNSLQDRVTSTVTNVASNLISSAVSDAFAETIARKQREEIKVSKHRAQLQLADSVVEAPFIELEIGGYKIGSYRGDLDMYPNYVSSLNVTKQNGVINQYVIQLIHQIRPGEDSNLLDELLSRVNYDKISIKYGDSNSSAYFQDTEAMITNVTMNRNYASLSISYTVEATSEGSLIKTYTTSFPAVTDKPSNVIRNLVYGTSDVSNIIRDAFSGMKNTMFVESNGLIPNNDSVVDLEAQHNVNTIDYLNYLVATMSNQISDSVIRQSVYYLTFIDNDLNNADGAYFKITEVQADHKPYEIADSIYSLTVGYPDDNIFSFTVDSTDSWELLYKNSEKAKEYFYSISLDGNVERVFSPTLSGSINAMSEISKNWWTQMVKFPITAKLTIRGLLKPIMLMDYINIEVLFYGIPHITSGTYAIIGQTDSLSATGYRTELSLVRVSGNE